MLLLIQPTPLTGEATSLPVAIGLALGALVILCIAVKITKFLMKFFLILAVLAVLAGAAYLHFVRHAF